MSEKPRRRPPRILCVSADEEMPRQLDACLGGSAVIDVHADPDHATDLLRSLPFSGAVFDARLPGRQAVHLANVFVRHQPAGRAVIACVSADATTLLGIAARDPRVEVVFHPWDEDEVRERLLGPIEMGAFTGGRRPRGLLERLLERT